MRIMQSTSERLVDEEKVVAALFDVEFPKWIYDEIPKLESDYFKSI